ncbi:hypothetical protein PMAYCL1PPCAC_06194, partial [Pristionchus mayeri]
LQKVLATASSLSSDLAFDDRPLLFVTIINEAFQELTMNWMCNVQPFERVLNRTLIIAGSKRVCERIGREYNEVSCVVLSLPSSFNGHFEGKSEHRREFTAFRMHIIERIASAGINFLYFDPDSLWLRDPSDLLRNTTERDVDIVIGEAWNQI